MGRPHTSKPPLPCKEGQARAGESSGRQKTILLQSSRILQNSMRQDHKGTQDYCGVIFSISADDMAAAEPITKLLQAGESFLPSGKNKTIFTS